MILVVTEKPSVAYMIGQILGAKRKEEGFLEGGDYVVSWCYGHLAEYVPPEYYDRKYREWRFEDLPIIPEHWELSISSDKREQFKVLKALLNDKRFEYVVNACDAGREGELIFRRVYELSKSRMPVQRLWISSMEDDVVRRGFSDLKDVNTYQGLADAAVSRAQADWLVGMNATRAYTTKYSRTLRAGRVQTPTLAMIVKRESDIRSFKSEPYYYVLLDMDGVRALSDKISDKREAEQVASRCNGKDVSVVSVQKKEERANPPKLYDLTTLQREANRFYGLTAKQTLELAQMLYEKKLITYPRTDSRFLTEETGKVLPELLKIVYRRFGFEEAFGAGMPMMDISKVVNDKKVSDHHAILITMQLNYIDFEELSDEEKKILFLIAQRMLAAVTDSFVYEKSKAELLCEGITFHVNARKPVSLGWKQYESFWRKRTGAAASDTEKEEDDGEQWGLPGQLKAEDVLKDAKTKVEERMTKPPKPYTEDSLLHAMEYAGKEAFSEDTERKGLGTPATRASIIEKLIRSGYVRRKGKQLIPTDEGIQMMEVMPDVLKSADMTAEWENKLLLIEKNQLLASQFMEGIKQMVCQILRECSDISEDEQQRFRFMDSIGICPKCGSLVFEGRRNFYCSNKECRFVLWKENYYLTNMHKVVDSKMASEWLKSGKTFVKDLYSPRTGKKFSAEIYMDVSGDQVRFQMAFPSNKNKQGKGKRKK